MDKGLQIHSSLDNAEIEKDVHLQTVLIDFYGSFGHIESAADIFYSIPMDQKTIIAVNAMMTAYIHCDLHHEALNLYQKLSTTYSYLTPDLATYRTILKACCCPILVPFGRDLHSKWKSSAERVDILNDPEIVLHLITMYGSCGYTTECESVFSCLEGFTGFEVENTERPNVSEKMKMAICRAMLSCYANVGDLEKATIFWEEMKRHIDGNNDPGAYVAMLHCCSTSGDVEKAKEIWNGIQDDEVKCDEFVISAFVDCLAKNGSLEETMGFMMENEYKYPSGWLSLMSACRQIGDISKGQRVYDRMKMMFDDDAKTMSAASLLMSHLFASRNEFEKQKEIREEMKRQEWGQRKGTSEVYVDGKVYVFQSGAGIDDIYYHNEDEALYREIDGKLKEICGQLKEQYGFEHDYKMLTRQCEGDGVKGAELRRHAEKQALAFLLLKTDSETPLVIKNTMRICTDCHEFMRLASRLTNRCITIVDPNRVHTFKLS